MQQIPMCGESDGLLTEPASTCWYRLPWMIPVESQVPFLARRSISPMVLSWSDSQRRLPSANSERSSRVKSIRN